MGLFFAKQYIASENRIPVVYDGVTKYLNKENNAKLVLAKDLYLEYLEDKVQLSYRDNKRINITAKGDTLNFYLFDDVSEVVRETGEIETVEFTCKDKTIHIKNGASVFEDIFERHVS
jgi:hypothetical protein